MRDEAAISHFWGFGTDQQVVQSVLSRQVGAADQLLELLRLSQTLRSNCTRCRNPYDPKIMIPVRFAYAPLLPNDSVCAT